jgi:NADH dehydrogenase
MGEPQHVVIVGGGFGGLGAAIALKRANVRITLVDRRNYHLFQPLLYQVATAGLSPSDIAEPLRVILRNQQNAMVRLAEVSSIDLASKTLRMTGVPDPDHTVSALQPTETLSWDKLILAPGTSHAYFGHDAWEPYAPGLKTLGDALEMRRKVLTAFERAEWTEDPAEREACTTFVIVGGGPTGVELAGAIAEIALRTMRKDFRRIDTTKSRIVLLEAGPAVLAAFPEKLQQSTIRALRRMGVEVRLSTAVTNVDDDGVDLADGSRIRAGIVLWAAGVAGSPLARTLGVEVDRAGRIPVEPDLSLKGHRDVFVIGDLAIFTHQTGKPLPGVAQVAMQMGARAAANVRADLDGKPRKAFRYWDKGDLATIGRSRAVFHSGKIQISGLIAWLIWAFIHLIFLVTFRSRVVVFVKWAWAYITMERSNRLIWQGEVKRPARPDSVVPDSTGVTP